jgi:hypothetical protein
MTGPAVDQANVPVRQTSLWGLLVEFDSPDTLVAAAEEVRIAGFTRWDAHTPFAVHGLDGAMGIRRTRLPVLVALGGTAGVLGGILLQWWTNAVDYPFLISGKPLFSLPANIPVAFETTILLSALTALFGMLASNGLPQLHHPLFASRRFRRATDDRYFISVESADPLFDRVRTRAFLESLGGVGVEEVEE